MDQSVISQWVSWVVHWLWRLVELTIGKVQEVYELPFQSLPLLEQLLYIAAVGTMAWIIFLAFLRLQQRLRNALQSIVQLLVGLLAEIPVAVLVLIIATAAAWLITTLNIDIGVPNLQGVWKQLFS